MFCNGTLENLFCNSRLPFLIPNPDNLNSNHVMHTKLHTLLDCQSLTLVLICNLHNSMSLLHAPTISMRMAATITISHENSRYFHVPPTGTDTTNITASHTSHKRVTSGSQARHKRVTSESQSHGNILLPYLLPPWSIGFTTKCTT